MLKLVITASALALSAPVMAQDMGMDSQTEPSMTPPMNEQVMPGDDLASDPAAPMQDQTGDSMTELESADQAMTQDAEPQPANDSAAIEQFVEQQFPSYDGDGDGELSQTEFAAWMAPMHQAEKPDADAAAASAWAAQAFAQADTDGNAMVSKDELKTLLAS